MPITAIETQNAAYFAHFSTARSRCRGGGECRKVLGMWGTRRLPRRLHPGRSSAPTQGVGSLMTVSFKEREGETRLLSDGSERDPAAPEEKPSGAASALARRRTSLRSPQPDLAARAINPAGTLSVRSGVGVQHELAVLGWRAGARSHDHPWVTGWHLRVFGHSTRLRVVRPKQQADWAWSARPLSSAGMGPLVEIQ